MEALESALKGLNTEKTNRILFVETLHLKNWNGYTARHVKGVSGTHIASVYLAEELVKRGYDVEFISPNIIPTTYLGVKYAHTCSSKVYDYVFITNNFLDLQIVNTVVHYKKLFIILNNPLLQPHLLDFFKVDRSKIVLGYVSPSSKHAICLQQPTLTTIDSMFLYNSMNVDDIVPIDNEKTDSFVFFACSDRGYKIAAQVAAEFPTFKLHSNTYADELKYLLNEQTGDTSKLAVFKCLAQSKYFVYPLVNLEKGSIHYDTFAYVILEALLHGVVVITVRNPVFEELFGDAICYINVDDIMSLDCFKTWSQTILLHIEYPVFLSVYVERFVEKVKLLESDTCLRNEYIKKGLALRDRYSSKTITTELLRSISSPRVLLYLSSHRQVKEYDYFSHFFNKLDKLRQMCDLYIHCNNKDVSEDLVKYYKQFDVKNKQLHVTSKNCGYNMGHIEMLSDDYDAGVFAGYDYVINCQADVFIIEEEPLLDVLNRKSGDSVFFITKSIPDDERFFSTDFLIFRPKLLTMNIFKDQLYKWGDWPEHYLYYILQKYNIKYEFLKRFDNDNWQPMRLDLLKLWHEHDLSLIETYVKA
jgi:glycosyltransferase involved in cell wall biosynthesis